MEHVSERLAKTELSTNLDAKNASSSRKTSAFGGFKKGFLTNASNCEKKKNVTRACATEASSSTPTALQSLASGKLTSKPSKLSKSAPEASKSETSKSAPEASKSETLKSTPKGSNSTSKQSNPASKSQHSSPKAIVNAENSLNCVEEVAKLSLTSEKSRLSSTSKSSTTISPKTTKLEALESNSRSNPKTAAEPATVPFSVTSEVKRALSKNDPSSAYERVAQAQLNSKTSVGDILEDPAWLAILAEFQADAEAAMAKYAGNPQVRSVMLELCGALGDNFLNARASAPKSEDETLLERMLAEPRVRDAMQCSVVQRILDLAKAGRNDDVRRLIAEASDTDRRHVQTLIDFGLLSFAC